MSFGIYLVGYTITDRRPGTGSQFAPRAAAIDRGGHSLFGRRRDRPWRDGDPPVLASG